MDFGLPNSANFFQCIYKAQFKGEKDILCVSSFPLILFGNVLFHIFYFARVLLSLLESLIL